MGHNLFLVGSSLGSPILWELLSFGTSLKGISLKVLQKLLSPFGVLWGSVGLLAGG